MAGSKRGAKQAAAAGLALLSVAASCRLSYAETFAGREIEGASPGERAAIAAVCDSGHGSAAQALCRTNQAIGLLRLGRKPDLTVASPSQKEAILDACPPQPLVGDQFACERKHLAAAGLPVRDEPGSGPLHVEAVSDPVGASLQAEMPKAAPTFFSLEKWRRERPPMPAPYLGPALSPAALYDLVAPSVYIVLASDHPIELAERVPHAQGSAVAVTSMVLVTNCHVLEGRPQISISQHGKTSRARLIYADPGGDRCFLKSDAPVRPVPGVQRADRLKLGQAVFSLGAPGGVEETLGSGVITGFRSFEGVRFMQNTASIAHGSSGGGLFDDHGNLVGITSKIFVEAPNSFLSIAADDFWP